MNKQKHSDTQITTLKKSLLIVNVAFFAITSFATLITYQFSDEISNQSLVNTVYSMMFISVIFFIYGFWLRSKARGNRPMGIFSGIYAILISILLFFTSNMMYESGVEEGTIQENVHFISFSLIQYLIIIAILAFVMFIVASPKLLNKEIQTTKTYIWASLLGIGIVIIAFIVMMVIKNSIFNNPRTVKDTYNILVGSVGFGYIGSAILIVLIRSKSRN
jgi:glucan phosphoethanolaminetransferase (alkaline phosphatase superfamily)